MGKGTKIERKRIKKKKGFLKKKYNLWLGEVLGTGKGGIEKQGKNFYFFSAKNKGNMGKATLTLKNYGGFYFFFPKSGRGVFDVLQRVF